MRTLRSLRRRPNGNDYHGMNWIRREKRLAIYLRDGMACCYCGAAVEDGAKLTLDHLRPYAKGGSNEPANLITACHRCNAARGARPWRQFAAAVAGYLNHQITADGIVRHIERTRRRKLDVPAAKRILSRRSDFAAALQAAVEQAKASERRREPESSRKAKPVNVRRTLGKGEK